MRVLFFLIIAALWNCGDVTQETTVINLPANFQTANDQSQRERDVLVLVEDETLFAEKTTETDWGNNVSESNVDYTSSPPASGDVTLAGWGELIEEHIFDDNLIWQGIHTDKNAQGFKIDANYTLRQVKLYLKQITSSVTMKVGIYSDSSGQPGSMLVESSSFVVNSTTPDWYEIDLLYSLTSGTQYHIVMTHISGGYLGWIYNLPGSDLYLNGSAHNDTGSGWQSMYFTIDFHFKLYAAYDTVGDITTDNIDIGEVPTVAGEWALEDIQPDDSTLIYTAEYSTTGAWGGEEVSIGVIVDGDPLTVLARYWRVKASFTSSTDRSESPTLQSIKADYTSFKKFNKLKDMGYEPLVDEVSSLTSKVDLFDPASIGTISVSIQMTDSVSDWVYSDTLFNKIVRVKLGFRYDGFSEVDYIHYFTGAIDDWDVDDGILNLELKDLSKDWKLPIPRKWESVADDVTYTAEHPVDVILDIFQNEINVRDSGLLLDFFATVKANTPGYKVTRTITKKVEDAKKLVEELRFLLFAYYLPRGDGKIGLKQFDSSEAIQTTFTDDNTIRIEWEANSESLINRTELYFDWDTLGDDEENFDGYDPGDDATSQTDFRAIVPFKLLDKWTQAAEATQISGLETKILDQFDTMPAKVRITCDAKDIAYEAGDMVGVTTVNAPGSGGAGITDEKYLITSKNLDFIGDKIVFEGLKVAV